MITFAIFVTIAGFIIGLGAVTVIDIHGFLGRTSPYWNEATIRTHKITKPLIWIGTILATIGGALLYSNQPFGVSSAIPFWHALIAGVLIINGSFLTFYISPRLLQREKEGRERELLPTSMQHAIAASFVVSFVGWWVAVALFACYVVHVL